MYQDANEIDNGEQPSGHEKKKGESQLTAINIDEENEELIIDEGNSSQPSTNETGEESELSANKPDDENETLIINEGNPLQPSTSDTDIKTEINTFTVNSNDEGGSTEKVLVIVDENSLDADDNDFDDYETFKELMLNKNTVLFIDNINQDKSAVFAHCDDAKSDSHFINEDTLDNTPNGSNANSKENCEGECSELTGCALHTDGLESLKETVEPLKKRHNSLEVINIDSSGDESDEDVVILSSEDELKSNHSSGTVCGLCKFAAESFSDLTHHIDTVHKGIKTCLCLKCRPTNRININEYFTMVNKRFLCRCCSQGFIRMFDLKRHFKRLHDSIEPLKCNQCEFSSNIEYELKVHMSRIHDENKGYPCIYCDVKEPTKVDLNRHMAKMHDDVMSFECNICGKKKLSKLKMVKHIKVDHLRMKRHRCSACTFNADDENELIEHIKLYHLTCNKSSFRCAHCLMKFNSLSVLHRHIIKKHKHWKKDNGVSHKGLQSGFNRVHKKMKYYKCNYCDFMSARKITLVLHMSRTHQMSLCNK